MERILMVGSGHLARALWEGWQLNPQKPRQFVVLARSEAHRNLWETAFWDESVVFDVDGLESSDVVILAVKPKDVARSVERLAPVLGASVVISPVAGWTTDQLRAVGIEAPLVRIMPNVCAAVGASTTLAAFDGLTETQRRDTLELLAECGSVTVIDETLMNPYTALVGSGPAYIFLLLEALIEGGRQLGADTEQTRQLVSGMVEGAARLARNRAQDSLSDWIRQVASPGGTTEALLGVLKQSGWSDVIQDAVVAASQRAQQLGARG